MLLFTSIGLSWATNYRIDTQSIPDLQRSSFESHMTGWMGLSPKWVQRIYVGPNLESTQVWIDRMKSQHYKETFVSVPPFREDAIQAIQSDNMYILQLNNVVLACYGEYSMQCVDELQNRMTSSSIPCAPPKVIQYLEDTQQQIQLTDGCGLLFVGGRPNYKSDGLTFDELPSKVTIYNRWAESWQWTFDAHGTPIIVQPHTEVQAQPE